jgi:fructokinase
LADIFEAYRRQEEPDRSFAEDYLDRFGRALANLIDVLDPDAVVLGGGVSNLPELYSLGVQRVERCVFSDSLATPILSHQLGDSAGVIGAALIGR